MEHYLFYQHNVQKFFIRHIDKYDGVLIPFSISASFSSGTYGFLRALLAKDRSKHFAMDPRSALFQHRWARTNVRNPHRRTAAVFGEPFVTAGLTHHLTPNELSSHGILQRVTQACIDYQKAFRVQQEERRKLEKYRKLLGMDTLPEIENPQRFIPPYFLCSDCDDPWLELSLLCIEYATDLVSRESLCPVIHFSDWTRIKQLDTIRGRLHKIGIKSYFVYPNLFKEHEASTEALQAYSDSTVAAKSEGFRSYSLHGGYFAIALCKKGLAGFGNGVGYGEWRDSGYHKGGTAEVRVYIPKLHRFLNGAEAQNLILADPEYFSMDSDLLSEYVEAGKALTEVEPQQAFDHFMESRSQEINFVEQNGEDSIISELLETIKHLAKVGELELQRYGSSLRNWAHVLATRRNDLA